MITVQNPYSLLNRLFEVGSAEICKRENVGLLAYSPLGFGVLSGKYRNGNMPENSRLKLFSNLARFSNDKCFKATDLYYDIAKNLGLNGYQTLIKVVLPLSKPAIFSGLFLVVMEVLNEYGAVKYFGVNTYTIGIFRSWNSMNDSSLKDFKDVMDVNLTGSFLGLKYGTEAIRKHGEGGSIVMISSVLGKVGAPNTTAFCAAKGGIRLLAKAGACELGPEKIRVNSIHPGLTDTEIGKVFTSGLNEEQFVSSNIPLERKATAEEIAKTILYLVSDESFFMTGAELTIDGGLTAR